MEVTTDQAVTYKRKDFISSQEPRWCSGCGDYFVFQALTSAFANLGVKKEDFLVVSGIGCSSRLPYYSDTFGFHTIHGRAPTVAMGAHLANPDLSVWVVTGDGDGMSIGGNHLVHLLRRNPNINVLLFNNEIYGLTKGQASPTSKEDLKTKSTPWGSIDAPLDPLSLAITAGAGFVARVVDTNLALMKEVFTAAHKHKGVSFIEIYTNCVIFNDGVFKPFEGRKERQEATVELKAGEPLIFGAHKEKAISLDGFSPKIVSSDADAKESLMVHKPSDPNPLYSHLLANMRYPEHPIPVGILRDVSTPSYHEVLQRRRSDYTKKVGKRSLKDLFEAGDTWKVP